MGGEVSALGALLAVSPLRALAGATWCPPGMQTVCEDIIPLVGDGTGRATRLAGAILDRAGLAASYAGQRAMVAVYEAVVWCDGEKVATVGPGFAAEACELLARVPS